MPRRFNLNDRPVPSGSMDPRFSPRFADDNTLNHRLGPRLPSPLIRETTDGAVQVRSGTGRMRRMAGMGSRFTKD